MTGIEEISEDELPVVSNVERNSDDTRQSKRLRSCRSSSPRKCHNQGRNLINRQRRDQHVMVREVITGSMLHRLKLSCVREMYNTFTWSFTEVVSMW